MVAVFDTAFHQQRPEPSRRYALPDDLSRQFELWRYGFHGTAHASLVDGVAALEGSTPSDVTAVVLQLGRGCSACAVERGVSIETSMGFTPLEGLMMGTRSGDVDPGLVLYLLRRGRTPNEVEELLERRSGLAGVGGSADMRELLAAEAGGDPRATLAVALFVRRIVMTAGAYLTLLDGNGAIVFGGGIGENAPEIRARVATGLAAWDVHLDPARNAAGAPGRVSADGARPTYVIRTDEELVIARAVCSVVG
jgi:acetate kinase